MSDPNDFNPEDELLGAIDELLEQVEEQRRAREPRDDLDALGNAPVDDRGRAVDVATKPAPPEDNAPDDEPHAPDTDPAQDALDAIDRVGSSAETLIDDSLDQLLDETDPTPEPTAHAPHTETQAEPEPPDTADTETETNEDPAPDDETPDPLDASIDQLDEALADAADEIIEQRDESSSDELVDEDPDSAAAAADDDAILQEEDDDALLEDAAAKVDDDLNLDDALDEATADMGEPDAAPAPADTPADQPAAENDAETSEPEPDAESDAQPEAEPAPATPEPLRVEVPSWFVRFVEIARPKLDKLDPRKGKTVDTLAHTIGWTLGALALYAPIYAFKLAALVSKPLRTQPPQVRAAIGYVALWTLMLALVVWFYAVFVRTPAVPEPAEAPTRVLGQSTDPARDAQQDI